jgi:hypothetical protein
MRLDRLSATHLELVPKHSDLSLVVLLHFQLILLELVNLVADELHLLDLLGDLVFHLFGGAVLIVELGSERVEDLIEAMIWLAWCRGTQIRIAAMLSSVEHLGIGRMTEGVNLCFCIEPAKHGQGGERQSTDGSRKIPP